MIVCGKNTDFRLGGSLKNKTNKSTSFTSPCQSNLDILSLISLSSYSHSAWILKNGEAFAVGDNRKSKIASTLPKDLFENDTKITITDKKGHLCKFLSAVCGSSYTLYQIQGETNRHPSQLVYSYEDQETIFLNIGKRTPLALFGGYNTAAVIDIEGAVIIITKAIFKSPASEIEAIKLPDGDKAAKVACCEFSIIALGISGRVYEHKLDSKSKTFSEIAEFSRIEIDEISGTFEHFLAVTKDGKVYGRGSNDACKLGMPESIKNVNSFTIIDSLNEYHIVEAFAGPFDSLFKTSSGQFLGCGHNLYGELMLTKNGKKDVYPPEETTIKKNATVFVGNYTTFVLTDSKMPPNSPNMKVKYYKKSSSSEEEDMQKLLQKKDHEINELKKKN
ncbi:putative E3 ubiquitin-protein ligase herc4 [Tritrichomonas musculus]|uniref:E3 ubiquitin-protein ligase herc4 n=1 Tax=Tritrichomonas musculus TaxID=1915356 RepID=A0ABR2HNQ8_9EUKA